jgi:hypothetical protein
MGTAVGALNLLLGAVYLQYGTMTLWEMVRDRSSRGFSHFGAAWIAMAFTCGPHHLVHGMHAAFEGRDGALLDLFVVIVGVPAGVTWFLLRVEAFRGGRGDRYISGTPRWIALLPVLWATYLTATVAILFDARAAAGAAESLSLVIPNLFLVALYFAIGYFLMRTQLANRRPLGGWSVSGLALTVIFPTCGVMHGVYAYYAVTGRYLIDSHGLVIDWLAVPAAVYFLWVVQALYRGTFRDWNGAPGRVRTTPAPAVGSA